MKQYIVKVKSIQQLTHNVLKIVTEKPPKYTFIPGQATEIVINKSGWLDEKDLSPSHAFQRVTFSNLQ